MVARSRNPARAARESVPDVINEKLDSLSTGMAKLDSTVGSLARDVQTIMHVVRDGGQQALVQQVPLLEARIKRLEENVIARASTEASDAKDARTRRWQVILMVCGALLGSGVVNAIMNKLLSPAPAIAPSTDAANGPSK